MTRIHPTLKLVTMLHVTIVTFAIQFYPKELLSMLNHHNTLLEWNICREKKYIKKKTQNKQLLRWFTLPWLFSRPSWGGRASSSQLSVVWRTLFTTGVQRKRTHKKKKRRVIPLTRIATLSLCASLRCLASFLSPFVPILACYSD